MLYTDFGSLWLQGPGSIIWMRKFAGSPTGGYAAAAAAGPPYSPPVSLLRLGGQPYTRAGGSHPRSAVSEGTKRNSEGAFEGGGREVRASCGAGAGLGAEEGW